jgi:hypothetical protein
MTEPRGPAASSSEAVPSGGKYVYCVTRLDGPRDFGEIGGARRVYTVHHRDLAAVVSDAPAAREASRERRREHELVNEIVTREYPAVPLAFGTVCRTEEDVAELLRSTYEPLADVLERVRDKMEFELKVLWDRERVAERVEREDPEICRLLDDIDRHSDTSTYYSRQELDRLVRAAVEAAGNRYAAELLEWFKPAVAACRSDQTSGDRVLLSVAFLVDRDGERAFDERVRGAARRYADVLTLRCTGPRPPHTFASVRLTLQRGD